MRIGNLEIYPTKPSNISDMVLLSKAKRRVYEKIQPQFWRYAGEEGDKTQEKWFKEGSKLLANLGGVRKLITTLALVLLKILFTPPRIANKLALRPSREGLDY